MNDTVKNLMVLADALAEASRWATDHSTWEKRQALQDELQKLFTPLSEGNIRWLWSEAHNDTTDRMPFQVFARIVEKYHGIGEAK